MQPSPLRLVAPFLLLSTVLARPALPSRIDLGCEEEVEVLCQGTTVTETVWLPSPSGASSVEKVGEEETEVATPFEDGDWPFEWEDIFDEGSASEEGEGSCEEVLEENIGDGSFELPNASEAVETPQQNANQTSATSPFSNATIKTIPPSGYRNALYFTNWYVTCTLSGVVRTQADCFRGIYGADYQPRKSVQTPHPVIPTRKRDIADISI